MAQVRPKVRPAPALAALPRPPHSAPTTRQCSAQSLISLGHVRVPRWGRGATAPPAPKLCCFLSPDSGWAGRACERLAGVRGGAGEPTTHQHSAQSLTPLSCIAFRAGVEGLYRPPAPKAPKLCCFFCRQLFPSVFGGFGLVFSSPPPLPISPLYPPFRPLTCLQLKGTERLG